jgi:hypothetical protein
MSVGGTALSSVCLISRIMETPQPKSPRAILRSFTIAAAAALLVLSIAAVFMFAPPLGAKKPKPHWLTPHGHAACGGQALVEATVYRSERGDVFLYAPNVDTQVAVASPKSRDLGRCNTGAFTPVFGLLFSKDADPASQCTSMWKGGGSNDPDPPHIVTDTYAEFPWGSCGKLRLDY